MTSAQSDLAEREQHVKEVLKTAKLAFADPDEEARIVRSLAERSLKGESFNLPMFFFLENPTLLFGCMRAD